MKKILVAGVILASMAGGVFAQGYGVPLADTAAPCEEGMFRLGASYTYEKYVRAYGVRLGYGLDEGIQIFGDLGGLDPDKSDMSLGFQVGGIYTLPFELPIDLAVRAILSKGFNDADYIGVGGGLMVSYDMEEFVEGLSLYGQLGIYYYKPDEGDKKTEAAITGGAMYALDENLSFFAEYSHIDENFYGGGIRWTFE